MKYDNDRGRTLYGYDGGVIVDGDVVFDKEKNEYIITDEDGVSFSSQDFLKIFLGKKIRMTCISFESIQTIESMLLAKPD